MQLHKPPETVKFILENLNTPERLDNHPWVMAAFVKEHLSKQPEAKTLTPGRQLASALANLFIEWMPSSPPRQGKRLDNRWGEYGLLAAQYVEPFLSGTSNPRSLKESWSSIDQAIAFLVSRNSGVKSDHHYQIIGAEPEAANSTLSDWHRKGIERFAEFVLLREKHIETEAARQADQKPQKQARANKKLGLFFRLLGLLFIVSLLLGAGWAYLKAQRLLEIARALRQELQTVQQLETSLDTLDDLAVVESSLQTIDVQLNKLDEEVRPYLWITQSLGWIPTYGGDIENGEALLDMALALNDSLQNTYQGLKPFAKLLNNREALQLDQLIEQVKKSQPFLQEASLSLQNAKRYRAEIQTANLSPEIREMLKKIEPALIQLEKGLVTARALPGLLGAESDGPKTYMLILQNEDELRATGGFLTAVGSVVVQDGKIINMSFENSYAFDDPEKPYPPPPWQLTEYMDASIYLLRDANWSPDFPTTAAWVEYLYAYTRANTVDGIVAIDQYAITQILDTVGPVNVAGYAEPISSSNIIATMRASKVPPEGETDPEWDRKDFIGELAPPILEKIMSGQGFSWQGMIKSVTGLLNEKHIILQFDDPDITNLLVEQGWNGQVVPFDGDYLMVVDSNIGFSKSNAVIEQTIQLDIDLSDPQAPRKLIEITYRNPVGSGKACNDPVEPAERYYPITRCYGNYLRIYTPAGSLLQAASPHPVPAEWTVDGRFVPARVDTLTDDLDGFSIFGTYFFVPLGETLSTSFDLESPVSILLKQDDENYLYRLKIQKQPGTVDIPIFFKLTLPTGATVLQAPEKLRVDGQTITGELSLREDILLEVMFSD